MKFKTSEMQKAFDVYFYHYKQPTINFYNFVGIATPQDHIVDFSTWEITDKQSIAKMMILLSPHHHALMKAYEIKKASQEAS